MDKGRVEEAMLKCELTRATLRLKSANRKMCRIIIFLLILVINNSLILLKFHEIQTTNKAELATLRQEIAQQANEDSLQRDILRDRIDYLTHPAIASERAVEWIMGRGEFAK